MKKNLIFSLTFLALAVTSCGNKGEVVDTRIPVVPITLKDTSVVVDITFPATIQGVQDVAIFPQVTGRIMKVLVKEGQFVKAGQVLFNIDDVPFKAAYDVAVANLEIANAGVETAKLTYESKKNLYDRQVISEYQLKLAKNDLLTAEAARNQAKANLTNAHNDLSFCQVRTLVSGYVGSLPYKVGSLVSPSISKPLTIVSDNSSVYVDFSVTENIYLTIRETLASSVAPGKKEGVPVALIQNNGIRYPVEGHMHSMSGMISAETGALPVRSIFPNPDALLLSGGSCTAVLSYTEARALLIPRTSIKELQNKMFVFVIKDGKLSQTEIKADRYNNNYWMLAADSEGNYPLKAGDQITGTTNRLLDGAEVVIKK